MADKLSIEQVQAQALVAMDQLDSVWELVAKAEDTLRLLERIWGKPEVSASPDFSPEELAWFERRR